jgi:hypothetical protein
MAEVESTGCIRATLSSAWQRARRWLGPVPPDHEFVTWCNRTKPAGGIREFVIQPGSTPYQVQNASDWDRYIKDTNDALNRLDDSAQEIRIQIHSQPLPEKPLRFKVEDPSINRTVCDLTLVSTGLTKQIVFDSLNVFHASLQGTHVVFENCKVATLTVIRNPSKIELHNTHVGKLAVSPGTLSRLEIVGGSVSEIEIEPPGGGNPFTGWVRIANTWFPTHKEMVQGSQPYRNMRHHLRTLENMPMADLFHALELKTERRHESSWTNRLFSYLYEAFSDFGSSIIRPIRWLIWLGTLVALILYWQDGAVPTAAIKLSPTGWQSVLIENGDYAPIWRAVYLSFYTITHPLGILSSSSLLVGRTPTISVMLFVQGVLSLVLITLTIFAIRRKFKLTQS